MRASLPKLSQSAEWILLGLLVFSVLWKGGKSLEATWMFGGVAALLCLLSFFEERGDVRSDRVPERLWIPLALFFLWSLISFLFSSTQNYGLDEIFRDAASVLLFFWVLRKNHAEGSHVLRERTFIAILVATLLACGFGIVVYALEPVSRFVGTFFDFRFDTDFWPNAFAEYLLLAWPVFAWFALRETTARFFFLRCVPLGLVFGFLFLTYSRGALIACAGQIALLGILHVFSVRGRGAPQNVRSLRDIGLAAALVCAIAGSVFLSVNLLRAQFYPVQSVAEKVTFTSAEGDSSITERRAFFSQAWAVAKQKPLFGYGPYSFRFVQPRYQTEVLATSDHPHNIFLKLAAERGAVAALLFLLFFGNILFSSWKKLRAPGAADGDRLFLAICFVSIAGVLAHNLIDYNLQFVGIALPFWMMLGFLGGELPPSRERIAPRVKRSAEAIVAALLLLLLLYEGMFLVVSSVGRRAHARGDLDRALVWYGRSQFVVFPRDLHLSRTQILFRKQLFTEAQTSIDTYLARNTEDPRAWRMQGDIAFERKDFRFALSSYEHAFVSDRWNDVSSLRGIVTSLSALNEMTMLDTRRPQIDATLQKFAEAIQANTHFIALGQNVEEFIAIVNVMADMYPEEAPRYEMMGAAVERHAKEERATMSARPPGYLW